MDIRVLSFKNSNFALLKNDAISKHIFNGEDWEPHFRNLCELILKQGDVCIDLGANFGYHTVTMSKLIGPSGKVFSFEIQRIIFQQLCANVFLNCLTNVYTFNNAIYNECGKIVNVPSTDLITKDVNIGDTKIGSGSESVTTITIDSLNLNRLDFMKIDVQGCELMALKGAESTIQKCRPLFFIELEDPHLRAFGYDTKTLIEYIFAHNYFLIRINNDYPCDHIAVPLEKEEYILNTLKNYGYSITIIKGKRITPHFDGRFGHMMYNNFEVYE